MFKSTAFVYLDSKFTECLARFQENYKAVSTNDLYHGFSDQRKDLFSSFCF